MIFTPVFLSIIAVAASASGQPAFEAGSPMVVTAGNDVGWQVTSIEEARTAFKELGQLRGSTEKMKAHWEKHGSLYAAHGGTAFEPYVKWMLLEPEDGVWAPAFYDAE
jgi:hypothetical protein